MDNKRKRPTGAADATAPNSTTPARASRKRAKGAEEEVEEFHLETDVTLLQYQHRAMWLRLKEKNRVISELKERLDSVAVAHYNCQQVTAAVVSQVSQLAADLQTSASRLDRSVPPRPLPADGSTPARSRPDLLELLVGFGSQGVPVPHNSAALKTDAADSKAAPSSSPAPNAPKSEAASPDPTESKEDGSEDSDEESPLARYSHVTAESLQQLSSGLRDQSQFASASMTAVVEAIERLAGIQSDILSLLRSPTAAAPEAVSQRLADLESQLDTTQRASDSLQAQNHSLSAQLQAKSHEHVLVCRRADELYDELENTKAALNRARRKLDRLGVPSTTAAPADAKAPAAGLPVLKVPSLGAASQPSEPSAPSASTETKVKENGEAVSAEVQSQVETLRTMADMRLSEINQLREERLALHKEIDRLKAASVSEDQVRQSATYQVLHQKCQIYVRDANDRKDRYDALVRDFTELRVELDSVRKQLTVAEDSKQRAFKEQFDRLADRLKAVTAEKDRLQLKLDSIPKENDPDIKAQLIKQYEQTLHQQTMQLKALQEERKRHQSAVRSTEQQTKDMLLQSLIQAQDRERVLTEREKQLRVQLETASSRPRSGDTDRDEVTVLRATEQRLSQDLRAAREEVEALKAQQKLKASEEVAKLQADLLALRTELSSVKNECDRLRGECGALGSALDEIGPGFEESVEQNKTLLKQLQDAESAHSRLLTEKLKVTQSVGAIKTERDRLALKLQSMDAQAQAHKEAAKAFETTVQGLQEVNAKHLERLAELERRAQELQEQKDANVQMMMDFQIQAETARSQSEQQLKRVEEEQKKADAVERKLKRAEETARDLAKKQEKQKAALGAGSASSAVTKGLEEELAVLKHQIRCSVCSDRHKSVVITKCFHMFCKECIDRNLKIRHRKCPGCGISFGQDDVHEIYLT